MVAKVVQIKGVLGFSLLLKGGVTVTGANLNEEPHGAVVVCSNLRMELDKTNFGAPSLGFTLLTKRLGQWALDHEVGGGGYTTAANVNVSTCPVSLSINYSLMTTSPAVNLSADPSCSSPRAALGSFGFWGTEFQASTW